MKKLFLAVSICAIMLSSNLVLANEAANSSKNATVSQRKIVEAAALNWAKEIAHDMQLSADPLARGMAEISLQLIAVNAGAKQIPFQLTQDQKLALYSLQTPMPLRILYLHVACGGYTQDAVCDDIKMADALIAGDSKNAFAVLLGESYRANATITVLKNAQSASNSKKTNLELQDLIKVQKAQNETHVLQGLAASNNYYDYAQEYKAPILIAVKHRPPPPEVLASFPIAVAGVVAAFAPEDIASEVFVNGFIAFAQTSYRLRNVCSYPETAAITAQCARISELILANRKNSAVSAALALHLDKNHDYTKRMTVFSSIERRKVIDPTILLSIDWLALRGVLNKAVTEGDVAAIPAALNWAEMAYAKIPNRSPEAIATEAKARAKRAAESQADMMGAVAAENSGTAIAAELEATSAAAAELKRQTAKPSGADAYNDVKANPVATDFKSDSM